MKKFLSLIVLSLLTVAGHGEAKDVSKTLTVEEVAGTFDIQPDTTTVGLTYRIANHGDDRELSTPRGKAKLNKEMTAEVALQHPVDMGKPSKKTRSAKVSTQLYADGEQLLAPAAAYSVKVILPADATKLLSSNKKLIPLGREAGRLAYAWQGTSHYLTSFYAWWTTSTTDLALTKTIIPDWENRKARVIIDIRNESAVPARNIMVKEDFPSRSFSGLTGESDGRFITFTGEANDARLIWECPIAEIGGGRQARISYAVELKHAMDEIALYETRAMEEGEVIALSEAISARK
jgi:hypothetical protein